MAKYKMKATLTFEYEMNTALYSDTEELTPEQCAEFDAEELGNSIGYDEFIGDREVNINIEVLDEVF